MQTITDKAEAEQEEGGVRVRNQQAQDNRKCLSSGHLISTRHGDSSDSVELGRDQFPRIVGLPTLEIPAFNNVRHSFVSFPETKKEMIEALETTNKCVDTLVEIGEKFEINTDLPPVELLNDLHIQIKAKLDKWDYEIGEGRDYNVIGNEADYKVVTNCDRSLQFDAVHFPLHYLLILEKADKELCNYLKACFYHISKRFHLPLANNSEPDSLSILRDHLGQLECDRETTAELDDDDLDEFEGHEVMIGNYNNLSACFDWTNCDELSELLDQWNEGGFIRKCIKSVSTVGRRYSYKRLMEALPRLIKETKSPFWHDIFESSMEILELPKFKIYDYATEAEGGDTYVHLTDRIGYAWSRGSSDELCYKSLTDCYVDRNGKKHFSEIDIVSCEREGQFQMAYENCNMGRLGSQSMLSEGLPKSVPDYVMQFAEMFCHHCSLIGSESFDKEFKNIKIEV